MILVNEMSGDQLWYITPNGTIMKDIKYSGDLISMEFEALEGVRGSFMLELCKGKLSLLNTPKRYYKQKVLTLDELKDAIQTLMSPIGLDSWSRVYTMVKERKPRGGKPLTEEHKRKISIAKTKRKPANSVDSQSQAELPQ